jgi:hypothetical protein
VFESGAGRGLLVPSIAVPLTLITVTLAWSYVLTGALHVRRAARWLVFLVYVVFGFLGLANASLAIPSHAGRFSVFTVAAIFLAVLSALWIAFRVLPYRRAPIAVEFALMLVLQTVLTLVGLAQAVRAQQRSDFPYVGSYLITTSIDLSRMVIIPFLVNSGSEMGNFARDVAGWLSKSVRKYAAGWMTSFLLLAFLAYRWFGLARSLLGGITPQQRNAWLGAALLIIGIGLIYVWRRQQKSGEAVSAWLVVALIVLPQLVQIAIAPLLVVVGFFFTLTASLNMQSGGVDYAGLMNQANQALGALASLSNAYAEVRYLVLAVMAAVVAWWAGRRGQGTVAAFALALAWAQILAWLMEPGHVLQGVRYQYADVDALLLVILTGATVFWLARGWQQRAGTYAASKASAGLTNERALHLLGLGFLAALLAQTGFLSDPFSPFFSFAGVFFLVFGILWGVLTAGGKFANSETPDYPRASRLLMYIGYALLSLAISHWFIVSHNVGSQALQSSLTMSGFRIYGLALAYLVFIEGGKPLFEE